MKKLCCLLGAVLLISAGCGGPAESPTPSQPPEEIPAAPDAQPDSQAPAASTEIDAQTAEAPKAEAPPEKPKKLTIGVMPKVMGIDFFNATGEGAKEAAEELGIKIDYDGPAEADVQKQVQLLETWIAGKYDAVAVAPNDPDAIAPVLKKARECGIKVITWDADAQRDARDFFVSQCTAGGVAMTLMDVMAEGAGVDAKYIIITGSLTAANQNAWMKEMDEYRATALPLMTNVCEIPKATGEDQALATQVTADCLKTYPNLQGIFAITSQALPGAAEAIREAGAANRVFLTGLATPKAMRGYVEDGTVRKFVLWNPVDLGYLAVQAAAACARGELKPGDKKFEAGRIGKVEVVGDTVILGAPMIFDKSNINDFDF